MSKRALGKGLGALLGDSIAPGVVTGAVMAGQGDGTRSGRRTPRGRSEPARLGDREAVMVAIDDLRLNPHQPRQNIDEEGLSELAASIKESGVLQPVLVRRQGETLELVAGERRVRAARMIGLTIIPALVCAMEDGESMKVALLENIQREDLNAIEEAEAYRAVMEEYGATHQELAAMLGKNRSTVSNMLRLLSLDAKIRDMVRGAELSMGHARALLALEDPRQRMELARQVSRDGLSVRALEEKVQKALGGKRARSGHDRTVATRKDPEAVALSEFEHRLQQHLGSPCRIRRRGERGRIEVDFFSNEELERILEQLGISSQL